MGKPAMRILLGLLVALPVGVLAEDYQFATNGNAITITKYIGAGGAVVIPEKINGMAVTSIGCKTFENCISLNRIQTRITMRDIPTICGVFTVCSNLITSVTIPSSVTDIGIYAFFQCTNMISVTIPDSVTTIGGSAFSDCHSLTFITLPKSITDIEGDTFWRCTSLSSITIPNGVTNIGAGAFYFCQNLASVTVPNSVTSIGREAFRQCINLTRITLPKSVTNIGYLAFVDCPFLTEISADSQNSVNSSVDGVLFNKDQTTLIKCPSGKASNYTIPNSVTNIGDGAFWSCISLTNVTIPDSVVSIGHSTFYDCPNLTSVHFQGNTPSLGVNVFGKSDNATIYYLPTTTGWGKTFGGRPTAVWKQ